MTDLVPLGNDKAIAQIDSNDITVIDRFLTISGQNSANTKDAYARDMIDFLKFVDYKRLHEITLVDVEDYLRYMQDAGFYAAASMKRKLAVVKSFLNYASRIRYLPYNVGAAVRMPKAYHDRAEKILTRAQVVQLIESAQTDIHRLIIRMLYITKLRVTEFCDLRWRDIKPIEGSPEGLLKVESGKGKKPRKLRIGAKLFYDILRHKELEDPPTEETPVFKTSTGKPLQRSQINRILQYATRNAGFAMSISPHWLRHAGASHALDNGCPLHLLRQDLGHKSLETTSIYVHADPSQGSALYLDDIK